MNLVSNLLLKSEIIFSGAVGIAMLALLVALGVFAVLSTIYHWVIVFRYRGYNRIMVDCNLSAEESAKNLLASLGYQDVKVSTMNFFAEWFFGNHYNPKKNTIYLRKNIINSKSITAIAIATKLVAQVESTKKGDKKVRSRQVMSYFGFFAPIILLPMIALGIVLDVTILNTIGVFTIIFTVVSLSYFVFGLVAMSLNIKIEKASSARAIEFFKETHLLTDEEIDTAQQLYRTYIVSAIMDYVYTILYIVWFIFRLIWKIFTRK